MRLHSEFRRFISEYKKGADGGGTEAIMKFKISDRDTNGRRLLRDHLLRSAYAGQQKQPVSDSAEYRAVSAHIQAGLVRGEEKRVCRSKRTGIVKTILARAAVCLFSALLFIVIVAAAALMIVHYGPSAAARDRFVLTVTETSAADFLATLFLSEETVQQIIDDNAVSATDDVTDPGLIEIPDPGKRPENPDGPGDDPGTAEKPFDKNGFEIIDITGRSYKGKLMIVNDPKRVSIGTPPAYGADKEGVRTIDMVRNTNSLAGVNGGGFLDYGRGNGGIPTGRDNSDGIVISKGVLKWGSLSGTYEIIGLNRDGILILGKMTGQEALDRGIVEALNFGPYLIVNGEPCVTQGFSEGGASPRTVIGQRKDGAILLLTIDGRQPSSLGATYDDLIEIMMRYGAVNAANLDGGSSTYMVYENEIITQPASLYGPRQMATSILVSRVQE